MKKYLVLTVIAFFCAISANAQMTKEGKVYKINTETLCNTKGYKGTTPLVVSIEGNQISDIEVPRNQEGPKYMKMVYDGLIAKYVGMKIKDVETNNVDAVTGATFTSKAVIDNVKAAVKYFKENK
ncbi:MAG: FMN-binding protein [Bacteroidaceae bacterium]|nr:FMN-binding protein [Bacteroidaceae bacterium]